MWTTTPAVSAAASGATGRPSMWNSESTSTEGWRLDEASSFTRNLAVSSWASHAEVNGRMECHESGFNRIVQLILREHPPSDGWLPASRSDAGLSKGGCVVRGEGRADLGADPC